MATSVGGAFQAFRDTVVDLDGDDVSRARSSRDYVFAQLARLSQSNVQFPCTGNCMGYGSFARKTKIRPLNDIDFMSFMRTADTVEQAGSDAYTYRLKVSRSSAPLAPYADQSGYVNSIRVLNKLKADLASVSSYRKAEMKRNQQAVVLNLTSYDWSFDIVPAAPVGNGSGATSHYLIPNGQGEWMRTDPRSNAEKVTTVNQQHSGNFLPLVRLVKHWNARTTKPRLMSFYCETLVLKVFDGASPIASLRASLQTFFAACPTHLWATCPSPTGYGPNLDADVDYATKQKVADAMAEAATNVGYALMYEGQSDPKNAIYWWQRVFGQGFPSYG